MVKIFDIGSVVAHITADLSGFTQGIDSAKGQLSGLGNSLQNAGQDIESFAQKASVVSAVVFGAFVIGAKSAVDYAANLEQARIAYDAFTGSAEKGGEALKMVTEFARHTPFQLPEVVQAGEQLLGLGFKYDQLKQKLIEVGSLGSLPGKNMQEAVDLFASAQAGMFRLQQFTPFGITRDELEQFGVTFTKAGSAVNKSDLLPALEKLINTRFGDLLEKQSHTFTGTVNNIKDDLGRLASAILGLNPDDATIIKGGIFEKIKQGAEMFYNWLETHRAQIEQIANTTFVVIEQVFTQVLTALKPVGAWIVANQSTVIEFLKGFAFAIGAVLLVAPIIVAVLAPWIAVFAAIAIATGLLYAAWQKNFLGIQDATNIVITNIMFYIKFFQMDWQGKWTVIQTFLKISWDSIMGILTAGLTSIGNWAGQVINALVAPFEEAWKQIQDKVNKIKDALDFTKRHSPSVVDIVEAGVGKVNDALMGLAFNGSVSLAPNFGPGGTMPTMGVSSSPINIYLDGAIIADSGSAMRVGELLGDSIIKRLQQNIRV